MKWHLGYHKEKGLYILDEDIVYLSPRYNKFLTVKAGATSDGATGALDIFSMSWWVHDEICKTCKWDDGEKISALQAALVLFDILWQEKHYLRSIYWGVTTFLAGCKKCRGV